MGKYKGFDMNLLLIIGLVLVVGGFIAIPGITPGAIPQATPTTQTEVIITPAQQNGVIRTVNVSNVTFKPRVSDVFAPGAPVDVECVVLESGGTNVYDSDAIATANATLEPGAKYTLACWDDGQTTNLSGTAITLDSSNDWYGYMVEITMPVKSEVAFPSADFTTTPEFLGMYKEAAPASSYIINPNGEVNGTTQADLSAGDIKNFKIVAAAADNKAFGDPYAYAAAGINMQLACDYNVVGFDDIKGVSATYMGKTYSMAESLDKPDYNASIFDMVYDIVGLSGITDNGELAMTITVDVSTQAPTNAGCDFNCYLIDPAFHYDATEGTGFQYDTDDSQDNSDIGAGNYSIDPKCT